MFKIKLCGSKKAVYVVWNNILGYGLADICETSGDEDAFTMICSISTKYDALPNQTMESKAWDGTRIDLALYSIDDAIKGEYAGNFTDKELVELSGMFGVEIYALGIPENQWWIEAEMDPQYPYYEYKNGVEIAFRNICSDDDVLDLDFVEPEDMGKDDWFEEE